MTSYNSLLEIKEQALRAAMRRSCVSALKEIGRQIDAYEKRHGVITLSDSYSVKRLEALRIEINAELTKLGGVMRRSVTAAAEESYLIGYTFNEFMVNGAIGSISSAFIGVNEQLLRASVDKVVAGKTLQQRMTPKRMRLLWSERETVTKAELLGWGAKKTAREIIKTDIAEGVDRSFSRAVNIARTETARNASVAVTQNEIEARDMGIDCRGKWLAAANARPSHAALRNKIATVWDPTRGIYLFEYNGMTAAGPGQWGRGDMDCNCRCAKSTVCIGYEEFDPKPGYYEKWMEEHYPRADVA